MNWNVEEETERLIAAMDDIVTREKLPRQSQQPTADEIHVVHRQLMDLYMQKYDSAEAQAVIVNLVDSGALETWYRAKAERYSTFFHEGWKTDWLRFSF